MTDATAPAKIRRVRLERRRIPKLKLTPSPQQRAVFDWVLNGKGNAFVEAVAGAGKTTTLVNACSMMDGNIAFAAYNKKIATEVEGKTTHLRNVTVGTFHRFGMVMWREVYPRVRVDEKAKRDAMMTALNVPIPIRNTVGRMVSLAKQSGVELFWKAGNITRWQEMINHYNLAESLEDYNLLARAIQLAMQGVDWSRSMGRSLIDFDDMIWLPIVENVKVREWDWVLVDEAQDTNPARRALARKMVKHDGRMIFVGDRHQAIYGFTGADNDAVNQIIGEFHCSQLPLTVTYRCPKKVVAEAQRYVSHITAHESAPEGIVRDLSRKDFWEKETPNLTKDDAILCRKTKPLVELAFKLIRKGIACHVEGRDIGQGLIKLAQRWKVKTTEALRDRLEKYRTRETSKLQAAGKESRVEALNDQVDTLLILMDGCNDVDCVVKKIYQIFQDSDGEVKARRLTLSTVHKAKGREWPKVYILGFDEYMPSSYARQEWEKEQEKNLIYVAITRAQSELILLEKLEDK